MIGQYAGGSGYEEPVPATDYGYGERPAPADYYEAWGTLAEKPIPSAAPPPADYYEAWGTLAEKPIPIPAPAPPAPAEDWMDIFKTFTTGLTQLANPFMPIITTAITGAKPTGVTPTGIKPTGITPTGIIPSMPTVPQVVAPIKKIIVPLIREMVAPVKGIIKEEAKEEIKKGIMETIKKYWWVGAGAILGVVLLRR